MRDLNYELKQLCRRNRDGSYATQRDRERVLDLVANQLQDLGYRHMAVASLKPKHVERLVEHWQAERLAVGTLKNRMSELRWWAEKIGKQNVIARDNDHYGIGNRQFVTQVSKARELSAVDLGRITDPYTAMSLRLQAAFGLRRAESIKIQPVWADRGNHGADATCPVSTSIFLRTVAEAAWDEIEAGKATTDVAPFWRVIDPKSPLAKKLRAGGKWIEQQRLAELR